MDIEALQNKVKAKSRPLSGFSLLWQKSKTYAHVATEQAHVTVAHAHVAAFRQYDRLT